MAITSATGGITTNYLKNALLSLKNGSLKRDLDLKLNSSDGKFDYTLYKTPNKWEDFYDHSTADFVYNKYQGYFDYFGYDKNSWKKI